MDFNALQAQAKAGDRQAEKDLFEALSVRFHLFAYQRVWNEEAAQDIAQEALAVVAREFRDLQVETSFSAWAYRVIEYRLLAYIKAKRLPAQRDTSAMADNQEIPADDVDPGLKSRLADCLRRVAQTNRRYARILNLNYQGFETGEICEKLGISVGNCYVLLTRARSMLEQCLGKDKAGF